MSMSDMDPQWIQDQSCCVCGERIGDKISTVATVVGRNDGVMVLVCDSCGNLIVSSKTDLTMDGVWRLVG